MFNKNKFSYSSLSKTFFFICCFGFGVAWMQAADMKISYEEPKAVLIDTLPLSFNEGDVITTDPVSVPQNKIFSLDIKTAGRKDAGRIVTIFALGDITYDSSILELKSFALSTVSGICLYPAMEQAPTYTSEIIKTWNPLAVAEAPIFIECPYQCVTITRSLSYEGSASVKTTTATLRIPVTVISAIPEESAN